MKNKELRWRKIEKSALSVSRLNIITLFDPSPDPFLTAQFTLPAKAILEYVASEKQKTGKAVTVTYAVMKMLSAAMLMHKEFNSVVLDRDVYELKDINVTVPFLIPGTDKELTNLIFENPQKMTLAQIEDKGRAMMKAQQSADAHASRLKKRFLPLLIIKTRLYKLIPEKILYRIVHERGLGSNIVLTNASHRGKARLFITKSATQIMRNFTRFYLHGVEERPVVKDGEIVAEKQLTISVAFDHRLIDGIHLNEFLETLEQLSLDPAKMDEAPVEN